MLIKYNLLSTTFIILIFYYFISINFYFYQIYFNLYNIINLFFKIFIKKKFDYYYYFISL
jgi:hypothetical protein